MSIYGATWSFSKLYIFIELSRHHLATLIFNLKLIFSLQFNLGDELTSTLIINDNGLNTYSVINERSNYLCYASLVNFLQCHCFAYSYYLWSFPCVAVKQALILISWLNEFAVTRFCWSQEWWLCHILLHYNPKHSQHNGRDPIKFDRVIENMEITPH